MRLAPAIPELEKRASALLEWLRPYESLNVTLTRMGSTYDGGYVLPDIDFASAISFGIGDNCELEIDLACRGTRVAAFDHTIEGLPYSAEGIEWFKLGLAPEDGPGFVSIERALQDYGLRPQLLLIDVEGAEWEALTKVEPACLAKVDCMVVEFHNLDRLLADDFWKSVQDALHALLQQFVIVHVHGNNDGPVIRVDGVDVPSIVECTFIDKDMLSGMKLGNGPWPGPLDAPNNPQYADIDLNPLWFR